MFGSIQAILRPVVLTVAAASALFALGCKPELIPGTSIEDTEENREIITFLTKYRSAVIERSVDRVVGLCAADYFEDGGTVDQTDDYGLDALKTRLTDDFSRAKEIQLEIIVQKVIPPSDDEDPAKRVVKVAYRYNTRALMSFPAGEKWISVTDVNQMVLRPDSAGGFLIVSGL
jgi:hypothetical protein